MFIEKRYSNSLQSRRDDMCILDAQDKHIVPTGLKKCWSILFYKHIVPTGLKRVLKTLSINMSSLRD